MTSLIVLVLIAGLAAGCSSKAPPAHDDEVTLSGERVHLRTQSTTKHYSVRGTSSETIFDYIERNGPVDDAGQRGSGLTEAKWSYAWKGSAGREGCGIASLTVSLDLVVTLPQHEAPQSLSPAVLRNWERFAADVATHEQRHVDIYLAGAETMKGRMQEITPKPSCDLLESEIVSVWTSEQKTIDDAQEGFHTDEDARISELRGPLQRQIEANRAKLSSLNNEIKALDSKVESLRKDIKATETEISPLKSQMESIEGAYGSNVPQPIYARYEDLRSQYNTLIARYNGLVGQHNATVDQRNKLAADQDQLITSTNSLVETYNWTR